MMSRSAKVLKNLIRSCLAITPVATAFLSTVVFANILPEQRKQDLQLQANLPFFVATSRFGEIAIELPASMARTNAVDSSSQLAAFAFRPVVLPSAADAKEAPVTATEYWKRLASSPSRSPAGQPRSLPPVRGEVLGSVTLTISSAPLTQRWRTAVAERADSYFGSSCNAERLVCASKLRGQLLNAVAIAQRQDEQEAVRSINSAVNARLKYRTDLDTYGVPDYWATASEILQRGTGDCKGYAILKMWMLLAAGFDPSQIRLQLVKIPATGQDHAILVVNTTAGQLVLDNIKIDVRNDYDVKDYLPLLSFVEQSTQIHGIKKSNRS